MLLIAAPNASAQGCVLIRQTSPMFGTNAAVDQSVGSWNVSLTWRNSTADHHYNGTVEQVQRQILGTNVVNKQNAITLSAAYQWTPRLSVNVGVPFINASWSIPSPITVGALGPRAQQDGRGLGDITALTRVALFNPQTHHTWNIMVGGGVKLPTGNNDYKDRNPGISGQDNTLRPVDSSVQPGDGGWGVLLDAQGFRSFKRVMAFGSGTYLANPRNTNNTPSILPRDAGERGVVGQLGAGSIPRASGRDSWPAPPGVGLARVARRGLAPV
jgi:hypothetical protein